MAHLSTLSLCNTALTQAHERARSLTLSSTSSPSADRTLSRALSTLAARLEGDTEAQLLSSIRTLVDVLEGDPKGRQMVADVRTTYPHFGASSASATERFPSTGLSRTSRPSTDEPYRDTTPPPPPPPSTAALLASQEQVYASQDTQLDTLAHSISRQRDLSLRMNDELELHAGLLDELDAGVEQTGLRLGRAGGMLGRVESSLKEHGSSWTIFALIVILVILIAVFK